MLLYISICLLLHTISSSSNFHRRSLLKGILHTELNKFQCDIHDLTVRNLFYSNEIILNDYRIPIKMK